ncbi:hypothetical protein [Chthonobacter rhizosphaerae]|uniref:hypothetical protein n=1 Tax=Chthonobacter rhizosphaerae TaxID=2735553 RepID=UPI0015EF36CF|nr:hypothetical protein [Chthonobacter rhizosphaerae]
MARSFSPQAVSTLSTFAAQLGLDLRLAADGSASFAFERSGLVTFTPAVDERVVMSLAALPGRAGQAADEALLASAGPDLELDRFVHAGLDREGRHYQAVSFEPDDFDAQAINRCLDRLIDLRRRLE